PNQEMWLGAVGVSDLDTNATLDVADRFRIGSVTKTYIAAAILSLIDDGALNLDDELGLTVTAHPRGDDITIRQLLNHTAGVPDFTQTAGFSPSEKWTAIELVALVADLPLNFEPGTGYLYSNTHYVLLGMVIGAVTGDPWQDRVTEMVDALELENTVALEPGEPWGDVVSGYLIDVDLSRYYKPSAIDAAANMVSNAEDVAHWGQALFGGEVLSANSKLEQVADPIPIATDIGYGLGAILFDSGDDLEIGHNGSINGNVAWVGYRPAEDATLVVMANAWIEDSPAGSEYLIDVSAALWETILDCLDNSQ
ncbi:MAG: beta-lactamase family protein, partial [Proteobacteria bacterium]|nr:beta-lactamase family protein [Pseudomonadota bacterium]